MSSVIQHQQHRRFQKVGKVKKNIIEPCFKYPFILLQRSNLKVHSLGMTFCVNFYRLQERLYTAYMIPRLNFL